MSKAAEENTRGKGRKRRPSRSGVLPAPPTDRTLDYADARPELNGMDPGETVLAIERLNGFQQVIKPALDERRRAPRPGETKRRGRAPSFHAIDYWRMEMLRRVIAQRSTQDTRNKLTTDKFGRTRQLLNFDAPRRHFGGKPRKWMEGIPSDGWMSDFRTKWLPEGRLPDLFRQMERWALAEKLTTLPGMADEFCLLYGDGSKLETHGTPPKKKDGKVVNEFKRNRHGKKVRAIAAPDAGFVPNSGANADHSGSGWNVVMLTTSKGTVLARRAVPINQNESETLASMAQELGEVRRMVLDKPRVVVLSTDSAFHSQPLRQAYRE